MHIYLPDLLNCSANEPSDPSQLDETDAVNGTTTSPLDGFMDAHYLNRLHGITVFGVGVVGFLIVASLIFCMFYKNDRMADLICRCRTVEEVYDRTGASSGGNMFFHLEAAKPLVATSLQLPMLVTGPGDKILPAITVMESPAAVEDDPLGGILSGPSAMMDKEIETVGEDDEGDVPLGLCVRNQPSPVPSDDETPSPYMYEDS